jgi:hypothetical protein
MNSKEIKNKTSASRSKSLTKASNSNSKPPTNKTITKKTKQSSNSKTLSLYNSKSKEKTTSHSKSKSKNSETLKATSTPPDTKITKNLDILQKLINNSQSILNEQNSLADKFSEITKRITSSDYEIERLTNKNKNENEEFVKFFEKYGNKLNQIANRLKIHTEEVEDVKCKIFYFMKSNLLIAN